MSTGVMVPNGWYGGYNNALSNEMVEQYIARYGGTADEINADVAEAYSVGEVAAAAIGATGGTNNQKIIHYLHSSGTSLETVQGSAQFLPNGENDSLTQAAFISQWQYNGSFVQVLPANVVGSSKIIYPKPNNW
jgi:branched-chain amino acid transport system substrate-binding protein